MSGNEDIGNNEESRWTILRHTPKDGKGFDWIVVAEKKTRKKITFFSNGEIKREWGDQT